MPRRKPYAPCSVCGADRVVRRDGRLTRHRTAGVSCPGSMLPVASSTYTYWLTAQELRLGDLVAQFHPQTGVVLGWFPVVFSQKTERSDGAAYVRVALPPELVDRRIPAFFHHLPGRDRKSTRLNSSHSQIS